jgi:hypothetical protein
MRYRLHLNELMNIYVMNIKGIVLEIDLNNTSKLTINRDNRIANVSRFQKYKLKMDGY